MIRKWVDGLRKALRDAKTAHYLTFAPSSAASAAFRAAVDAGELIEVALREAGYHNVEERRPPVKATDEAKRLLDEIDAETQFRQTLRATMPHGVVTLPLDIPRDRTLDIAIREQARAPQQKAEPAWKQDGGKPRMDLIAPEMLVGTANVLAFGATKYAERNWEKGMSWGRVFGALMRHMWAWWGGEKADAETGYSHLHHAACCLMFLIAYEQRKIGTDDRKISVDSD